MPKVEIERVEISAQNTHYCSRVLSDIASEAGQNPGRHAEKWLSPCHAILVAYMHNKPFGFAAYFGPDSHVSIHKWIASLAVATPRDHGA